MLLRTPKLTSQPEDVVYSGVITNLGVDCIVNIPETCPDKDRMDIFGVVDATITSIDMGTLEVRVEATRLVKAFERAGEWA